MRGEERAFENYVNEAVVLGLIDVEEGLRREDAGIVEQHIETTETVNRRFYDCFAGRRQGDIAGMHRDTLARRVDLVGSRLGFGDIATVDDDRTAPADEPGRDLFADPGSTSGDDCNLVLETHGQFPSRLSIDRIVPKMVLEIAAVKPYLSKDRRFL